MQSLRKHQCTSAISRKVLSAYAAPKEVPRNICSIPNVLMQSQWKFQGTNATSKKVQSTYAIANKVSKYGFNPQNILKYLCNPRKKVSRHWCSLMKKLQCTYAIPRKVTKDSCNFKDVSKETITLQREFRRICIGCWGLTNIVWPNGICQTWRLLEERSCHISKEFLSFQW